MADQTVARLWRTHSEVCGEVIASWHPGPVGGSPLPLFAVLITYREVFGKEPAIHDLHAILKKYKRNEVITFLGKLNCLLGTWRNAPEKDLDEKLANYMLSKFRDRLARLRQGPNVRIVFSRLTLLYLIKQASFASPDDGSNLVSGEGRSDIGVCCLMANDLVLPFASSSSDSTVRRLASLLPFSDYMPMDHYPMEIARTEMILGDILQQASLRERTDYLDLPKLFEDHFGFSAKTFCQLIFGCATKSLQVTPEKLQSAPDALIIRDTFFQRSAIPGQTVEMFFNRVTVTEAKFSNLIQGAASRPGDDLTIIQNLPLIEIVPKRYLCLDPGFLIEKAGRGFYWNLFSQLNTTLQDSLPSFWGYVFESYVNSIIQRSYVGQGHFIAEPRFPNSDGSFDACIREGRDLIVFEHKSSVIRADAKYGGDVNKLEKELRLKFIEGDGKAKKGVSQLSRNLERFFGGESLGELNCTEISRVYPVIVCLESSATVPYMARYLAEQFKVIYPRKKYPQVVTPLFTFGIADVENLLGYLSLFKFSEILESYHRANRSMLSAISNSDVPLLKGVAEGRNVVRERFSQFAHEMEKDLFPGEATQSDTGPDRLP